VSAVQIPAGAQRVALDGKTVIPGIINAPDTSTRRPISACRVWRHDRLQPRWRARVGIRSASAQSTRARPRPRVSRRARQRLHAGRSARRLPTTQLRRWTSS
jgi:imidazolonepropionase-like amidohydrolase